MLTAGRALASDEPFDPYLAVMSLLGVTLCVLALQSRRSSSAKVVVTDPIVPAPKPTICCPGGGVYFWWQIGALKRLLELYELPKEIHLAGASAGALSVCLAQCSVDPMKAYRLAYQLAEDSDVFTNPLGLCGKWGRLVHAWLDEMLPEDAAARCSGRCRIIVTRCFDSPRVLRADAVESFQSKEDLINSLMASTHLPFFMDGRPFSKRLGGTTTDGALLGFIGVHSIRSLLVPEPADHAGAVILSHLKDEAFMEACRLNGWKPISAVGTENFMSFGARWVEREAARGTSGELASLVAYRRRRPWRDTVSSTHDPLCGGELPGKLAANKQSHTTRRPRRSPLRKLNDPQH